MRSTPRFHAEEPTFDEPGLAPDALDLRLSPGDRPTYTSKAKGPVRNRPARDSGNGRVEPTLLADGGELRMSRSGAQTGSRQRPLVEADDVDEPPPPNRGNGGGGGGRRRRRRSRGGFLGWIGRLVYWCLLLGIWGGIALGGVVLYYGARLPPTSEWNVPKRPPNIRIVSTDGTLMGNRGDTGGEAVKLSELPPYLPKALIAIEDRRFYSHFGIDPVGLARAVVVNLLHSGVSQGGSTLTQQLAKNLFLTPDRTFGRKIQEVLLALWLEHTYTKNQIIELYLNRVYMGAGAYGVDAAAHRYFGKSARDVNLMEAAMLAGLLKAPSHYAPSHDPAASRARAEVVLATMVETGAITDKQRQDALALPRVIFTHPSAGSENYVADWVMEQLPSYIGAVDSDITVETTIDSNMQLMAEAALQGGIAQFGQKRDITQGALVSLDPTGGVKALVGGVEYDKSQYNRATTAKRQPGSSFKVFTYLAAMEAGLTPETVRVDEPVSFHGWAPHDFEKDYKGPMALKDALAQSINTIAAKLAVEVGPRKVVNVAQRLGITSPLQANASIALGTYEVTPLELTGAYVPFSNGGFGVVPHVIDRITGANGKVLYQHKGNGPGRVIDPLYLSEMDDMLAETLISGSAKSARIPGWQTGGKTGTSQDFRDAWFLGFTGLYTTGVWLGNDDGTPTKQATGGGFASQIWKRFMVEVLRGKTPVEIPGASRGFFPSQPQAPATSYPPAQVVAPGNGAGQSQPMPVVQTSPLTTGSINPAAPYRSVAPAAVNEDDTDASGEPIRAGDPMPVDRNLTPPASIGPDNRRIVQARPTPNGPVDGFLRQLFGAN
jgi:penicillin-binding protein 1A